LNCKKNKNSGNRQSKRQQGGVFAERPLAINGPPTRVFLPVYIFEIVRKLMGYRFEI
jgi:hypothetical protein